MEDLNALSMDSLNILIVEDSPTQAEQLKFFLNEKGFTVTVAQNGRQALAWLEGIHPALVISDIVMPEMDGYELCRQIRSKKETRHIPMILLTALANQQDILESLICGADSFITKPYTAKYLYAQIDKVLAEKSHSENEYVNIDVEIKIGDNKRIITTDAQRMVSMLLSSCDAAIQRNIELVQAQEALNSLNERLESLVEQRTAMLTSEILKREQLQDELQALSMMDELTGLHNRRSFMMLAEQHWHLALRSREEFVLLYADLDNLKFINDTLGHAQGDQAIRNVAQVMKHTFRESDIIARVGGDEFVILVTTVDIEFPGIAMARLCEKLIHLNETAGNPYSLALSIGMSHFNPDRPLGIQDMMDAADTDMYAQKRRKKNKCLQE